MGSTGKNLKQNFDSNHDRVHCIGSSGCKIATQRVHCVGNSGCLVSKNNVTRNQTAGADRKEYHHLPMLMLMLQPIFWTTGHCMPISNEDYPMHMQHSIRNSHSFVEVPLVFVF